MEMQWHERNLGLGTKSLGSGGSPPPRHPPRGVEAAMAVSLELRGPHPRPCCWSSTAFHRLGRARQLLGLGGAGGEARARNETTREHARWAGGGPCVSQTWEAELKPSNWKGGSRAAYYCSLFGLLSVWWLRGEQPRTSRGKRKGGSK
jgi:hypothetical protein